MSLINRMLQDLEARSSDGAGAGVIHGQVRAVPERRRTRAGWWLAWLALASAVVLGAALALMWLRRAEPIAAVPAPIVTPPELSLKLAADLSRVPLPGLQMVVPQNAGSVAAGPEVPVAPVVTAPGEIRKTEATAPIVNQTKESVAAAIVSKPAAPESQAPKASAPLAATPAPQVPARSGLPSTAPVASEPSVAATISKQVKDLSPQQHAENEYRKAATLIQQGRTAEAIDVLEQALRLDPQHSAARQTLVGILLENKRQGDAVRRLREGLSLDPKQAGLAMILARQLVEKGELQSAVDTLQTTLPYAVDRADYQAFLAALLQRQAKHKEAIEHYLSAVRKAPQSGIWWMGLGISLQAENRLAEAQDAFGRAKSSNSLSAELQAFVEQRLRQLQR